MNNHFDYQPNQGEPIRFHDDFREQPPRKSKHNGYEIAALCLGIISLVFSVICCCCYYVSLITAPCAIILSVISAKKNGGKLSPFAIAGLICAIIGLFFAILILVFSLTFDPYSPEFAERMDPIIQKYYGKTWTEFLNEIEGMDNSVFLPAPIR